MAEKNNMGLQEMFDYLRDDVKQFREETQQAFSDLRSEQRRFTEALVKHTEEDHRNFTALNSRLQRIEDSDAAVSKSKDARFQRFIGYGGFIVAALAVLVALLK